MKLAHLADVHLGFRQYHRLTSQGVNQREADVAGAFARAIDDVVRQRPDIVLISGDLFHSVRPTNPAILHAFAQVQRLHEALPDAPVVIIAGNHDTPRSIETGTILRLFEAVPGVHVVAGSAKELEFPGLDLAVLCVPYQAMVSRERPRLEPTASAARHVLVLHGELEGLFRDRAAVEYGGALVHTDELHADAWDYVAMGHYHVAHQVARNAWYAGSVEYVSSNPWGELRDEEREGRPDQKGWLLVDLTRGGPTVTFRPVSLARRHLDLAPVRAAGLTAAEVDAAICAGVKQVEGGIEHHVVRQVVYDVPRPIARELNYAQVREYKARALHYHLDLRRPERPRAVGVGAPGPRRTLQDVVLEYLRERTIDADLDRERLIALGRRYMARVTEGALQDA